MSSIIVRVNHQSCKDLKHSISKTISYISDKKKADSSIIDEYNIIGDYSKVTDTNLLLYEDKEEFVWSIDGDINAKKHLKNLNIDSSGTLWSLVISFPPDFALEKGLITKLDYYNLTKIIIPKFLLNVGFKLENITWYCSLHRNTDNPHLHINFFEHVKTRNNPKIPYHAIHDLKSDIANYLINNKKFYELRDKELKNIAGEVSLKDLTKVKHQNLFSDQFRKKLNSMLFDLYKDLPSNGRLQYNSKNMLKYRSKLNRIIEYILMHDSIKYNYARYLKILDKHQKELDSVYGKSKANKNKEYYNNQLDKLYSKIGNEILKNYKLYQSLDLLEKEKSFLQKHILNMNFKSKPYKKEMTKIYIAKDLYKICNFAELNYKQTKMVIDKWIYNSKYNFEMDDILSFFETIDNEISLSEYYNIMKKLGYDSKRLLNIKNKQFYQELNYKKFINQAIKHLEYELSIEEKQIRSQIEYELDI